MATFDLDFTEDTPEKVDSGGRPPVGFYLCDLADVYDDRRDEDKTILEFTIKEALIDGKPTNAFNGQKIFDRIEQPGNIESDDARRFAISKIKIRAHRLGLWDGEKAMKSIDFTQAIGAVAVVEQVMGRPGKEGTKYAGQSFVEVKFDGIYNLGHKKCPARWAQTSTTAAGGAATASPAAAPATSSAAHQQSSASANHAPAAQPANLWSDL